MGLLIKKSIESLSGNGLHNRWPVPPLILVALDHFRQGTHFGHSN